MKYALILVLALTCACAKPVVVEKTEMEKAGFKKVTVESMIKIYLEQREEIAQLKQNQDMRLKAAYIQGALQQHAMEMKVRGEGELIVDH